MGQIQLKSVTDTNSLGMEKVNQVTSLVNSLKKISPPPLKKSSIKVQPEEKYNLLGKGIWNTEFYFPLSKQDSSCLDNQLLSPVR